MDKLKEIFALILRFLAKYGKIFAKFVHQKSKDFPFLTKSLILHLILLFLVSGLLPKCSPDIEKPKIIEVSIIPMQVADAVEEKQPPKKKTPPKKEEKKPEPKKEEVKEKPKPKPEPKYKPKQVETKKKEEKKAKPESNIPALKKEEVKEKPKKIEEPKKEEKKEEKKQESDEEREGKKSLLKDLEKKESMDDLFEDLAKEEIIDKKPEPKKIEEQKKEEKPEAKPAEQGLTDEEERELGSLISKVVRGQVTQCWSIPIGAKNVENTTVALYIKLDVKGYAKKVNIIDENRYNSDNNYRVLADSAVWAIKECSPFQGLPEDKHEFWKEIQLTFDPSSVL